MGSPENYKYTKEHEWVASFNNDFKIGISDYAQHELGDVVYADLPSVGKEVKAGESFMTVESVKAVSDIYAPISGSVVAVNEALATNPELINQDPYNGGWIVVVKAGNPADVGSLMDSGIYDSYISTL